MSTTYEPGTVAKVTLRRLMADGKPRANDAGDTYLAFWDDYNRQWVSAEAGALVTAGDFWHLDVRPLVVLDLEALPVRPKSSWRSILRQWEHIARRDGQHVDANVLGAIADQIEAQTKPPKPAEPTGLGAVVEAEDGRKYVRTAKTDFPWVDAANPGENAYHWTEWGGLPTPPVRVISEGVES